MHLRFQFNVQKTSIVNTLTPNRQKEVTAYGGPVEINEIRTMTFRSL